MIKNIIFAVLVLFSVNTYALTEAEEELFRERVSQMHVGQKTLSVVLSTGGLLAYCAGGGFLSGVSAVFDTFPISGFAANYFLGIIRNDELQVYKKEGSGLNYEVAGGISAVIADLVTAGYDITDLYLDEPFFDEMINAYAETIVIAEAAFGETGYCIDQWEQLGILLGSAGESPVKQEPAAPVTERVLP